MINIARNLPAPPALTNKKNDGVKAALTQMFYGKCYLCEDKTSTSTEIEHFLAKSKHTHLEYDWDNLLLACHHCNSIKNYIVDGSKLDLINCTNPKPIVTDEIRFLSEGSPKESLKIELVNENPSDELTNTIYLLDKIFNADTESKAFDAKNLTDKVIAEIKRLLDTLHEFYNASSDERKGEIRSKIKDQLSKESPFTAFKIWYIKSRPHLVEFNDLLPIF
jgi:uncharacterized protein (TIGR02646 family)